MIASTGIAEALSKPAPSKEEIDALLIVPHITSLRTYLLRATALSVVVVGASVYAFKRFKR
jgi:hypothetical protein